MELSKSDRDPLTGPSEVALHTKISPSLCVHTQKDSMEAIVSFVVEQLGNWIKDEVGLSIDVKKDVEKLHSKFTAIRARLGKVEGKQFTDETVRDWLRKIKEVVYDVDDILDEWRTDALISKREKVDIGNRSTGGFLSLLPRPFFKRPKLRHEIGHRIREITERLDEISKEKGDFSWNEDFNIEEVELMPKMKARETGSLIDESMIFGRDGVKQSIINELISDNNREQKSVSITSIVGMGGLGKTTLAQLVCNDESVKTHFKKKIIWVCVSEPFDESKIANKVIKSLSGSNMENSDLDTLQHSLREAVSKMPFLLVLDDVWNEDKTQWEKLRVPLIGAAQGSKILITTRSHKAAEVMETTHFHYLERLSPSDCWNLFKSIAFKGAENDEFQELTKVGKDIVRRCKGLPLAVRAVGSLLGGRRKYEYWKHISGSRIWDCDDDILPALMLSYYSLPFHLKRCFSFCSLFPKDYWMDKDELVKLWMAHGLIESKKAGTEVDHLEEIGEMYLDDLLARSLFQDALADKDMNMCEMHDLVHDLATRVTDGDYRYMENEDSPPTNCHHLSFFLNRDVSSIPSPLCEATRLRTLLMIPDSSGFRSEIKAIPNSLFNHLRFLRALDVRETSIENLPSSISELKHLRYLNLSDSIFKELPESVTDLCNLQTLKLNQCTSLCMLPSGMSKMVQLRHLEIESTDNLTFLPDGLGNLTTLRTLSKFPVGDENRGCKIGELKNLNLLRGELRIENLERVLDVNEAREAQLNKKSYLQALCFNYKYKTDEEWRMLGDDEMGRMEGVFEGLGALHSNLKKLEIHNYVGSKLFSSWMDDEYGMPSLKELVIRGCNKLKALPDRLPCNLREVTVSCEEVTWMPRDALPLLESLSLGGHVKVELSLFPALKRLRIEGSSYKTLPFDGLAFLAEGMGKLKALRTLSINSFSQLTILPEGLGQLETLHDLTIFWCNGFTSLFNGSGQFKALRYLTLVGCNSLRSLSDGLVHFEALQSLYVSDCPKLQSLFEGFEQLKSLRSLVIGHCPELRHFPPLQYLTTLVSLSIRQCPLAKEQLEKEIREDRCNVSHILIEIDGERIQ